MGSVTVCLGRQCVLTQVWFSKVVYMSVSHVFYINLDRSPERDSYYRGRNLPASYGNLKYRRYPAVDGHTLDDSVCKRMVSIWTIRPEHHRAKMGCWLSHCGLLRQIVSDGLDRVLIIEDDAEVREVDIPVGVEGVDGVCFFGGWATSLRVCDAKMPLDFLEAEPDTSESRLVSIPEGVNYRILQSRAYYLPTHEIAGELLQWLESHRRLRAYDIMLCRYPKTRTFVYPALVTNRLGLVSSRDGVTTNRQDLLYYR